MEKRLVPEKYLDLLACPVCRAAVTERAGQLHCPTCRRAFPIVNGIPVMLVEEDLDPASEKWLESWNAEWRKRTLPQDGNIEADPAFADALQHIRNHAPTGAWESFLESGCGDGQKSLVIAREKKILVIGVDACLEACKLAKRLFEREGEQGFFVVGDLRRLPLGTGKIKYIYAGGSLEHFPDTIAAIKESYRVLKPGGRITATVPFVSLATLGYAQLWGNIPELPVIRPLAEWVHITLLQSRHMKYGYEKSFTRKGIVRYFKQVGFRNIRVDQFKTFMDFCFIPWFWMKAIARKLVQWRWFWPVIYIDADR